MKYHLEAWLAQRPHQSQLNHRNSSFVLLSNSIPNFSAWIFLKLRSNRSFWFNINEGKSQQNIENIIEKTKILKIFFPFLLIMKILIKIMLKLNKQKSLNKTQIYRLY